MKKIVVTGGSGFIGTNFIKKLTKKNCIIYNIDKLSSVSTPERFKNKKNFKSYYFYKLDLLNFKKIEKLIFNIKPDFIINFFWILYIFILNTFWGGGYDQTGYYQSG